VSAPTDGPGSLPLSDRVDREPVAAMEAECGCLSGDANPIATDGTAEAQYAGRLRCAKLS
jgi:hypothetical protein